MEYTENASIMRAARRFSTLAVLIIILDVYTMPLIPVLGCGEFVLICLCPYFFANIKTTHYLRKKYYWIAGFCVYGLLISLIGVITIEGSIRDVFVRLLREGFYYVIIFILGEQLFDYKIFIKTLKRVIFTLAVFVIFQAIIYYLFRRYIPGFILSARLNDGGVTGYQMYSGALRNAGYRGYIKLSGFLCEPSHCAHCFFILLLLLLFEKNDSMEQNKMLYPVIVSIAMILTMSTSAYLEMAIAWVAWLIVGHRKGIYPILLLLLVSIISLIIFSRGSSSNYLDVIRRFTNLFSEDSVVSNSTAVRVVRGYEKYNSLSVLNRIFGIGFGAYDKAVEQGLFNLVNRGLENGYMNSASYLLISSGIIGSLLFSGYLVSSFMTRNMLGKLLIIGLVIMFLGTSVYCSTIFIWALLLINHLSIRGVDNG